jgi:multiple sugar transport system permease protein
VEQVAPTGRQSPPPEAPLRGVSSRPGVVRAGPRTPLLDREGFLGPVMILPAVLYVLALVGFPFGLSIYLAMSDAKIASSEIHFVGLANVVGALASPTFKKSLGNTVIFTLVSQTLVLGLGKALATCLQQPFYGKSILRFLILLPWVAPISLGTIGWKWMLDSLYSPVNWVLQALHVVGPGTWPMWFGEKDLAMAAVIGVHVWRLLPFATILILAGLTSIPKEVQEAAAVDGAGVWKREVHIVWPLLRPIMTVAGLFGIIFAFTDMTVIYVLTRGGPAQATQVLSSLAFFTGILGGDLAGGAAISLFLFPVLLIVAVVLLVIARRTEVT